MTLPEGAEAGYFSFRPNFDGQVIVLILLWLRNKPTKCFR